MRALSETDDNINILLVDDEEALLNSIKRRLQFREFNVIAVNRGEKALEIVRQFPVDVAIVDLKMPGMSGKDVLVNLKRDYPWIEIIILTGHGSLDPEEEDVYGKAHTFLTKPCDLTTLLQVLVEAYKKKVMNKNDITAAQMEKILKSPTLKSTNDVLRKLKEIDKNHQQPKRGH
jgi:DNA-binding NtrC family response regulator